MLKFISVLFAGVLVVASLSPAQAQTREETILEVIEATHLLDQFRSMRELLPQFLEQQFAQTGATLSPVKMEIIKEITVDMYSDMEGEMMAMTIRLYENNFTQQELKDLLVFYRSETGMKLIDKTPDIMAQVLNETNSLVEQLMPKMQQEMTRRFQELENDSAS